MNILTVNEFKDKGDMISEFSPVVREKIEEERKLELLNAAETLKQQIMNKGRCKICTLKIPCKHISEIPKNEEFDELEEENQEVESSINIPNTIESPKSLKKIAELRFAETSKKPNNKSLITKNRIAEENLRTVRVKMKDNSYKIKKESIADKENPHK